MRAGQRRIAVSVERWPIRGGFTISRGAKHEAVVVVATIRRRRASGRGECVPYARYGESVEGVGRRSRLARPPSREVSTAHGLQALLPPGAARNALDCALWDLEAKLAASAAESLPACAPLHAVETAFTISLASPEEMAARAREAAHYPLLKLKLGGDGDEARLAAVRDAVPNARLIADANEAWRPVDLERLLRRGEGGGRGAHRAAAARRRRRSLAAHRANRPGLRRRVGA